MQSNHWDSSFDKNLIKIPSLTLRNKDFLHGMVVKIHDDEYEDCSLL